MQHDCELCGVDLESMRGDGWEHRTPEPGRHEWVQVVDCSGELVEVTLEARNLADHLFAGRPMFSWSVGLVGDSEFMRSKARATSIFSAMRLALMPAPGETLSRAEQLANNTRAAREQH